MTTNAAAERLLSTEELAEFLGVPEQSVRKWRYLGTGPRGVKVGRHVRYRMSDVLAYLEQHADPAA